MMYKIDQIAQNFQLQILRNQQFVLPRLGRLGAGPLSHRPGLVLCEISMEKETHRDVFLRVHRYLTVSITSQVLSNHNCLIYCRRCAVQT